MIIKRFPPLFTKISDFADKHGLEMEVHERSKVTYYAHFSHVELKEGSILIGAFGDGKDETSAILDYAEKISNRLIVVRSTTNERREIAVPLLNTFEI